MPVPLSNTGGCRPGCGSSVTDRQPVTERQAARGAHVSNTQHHMHNTQRHMHNTPCHVSNTTPIVHNTHHVHNTQRQIHNTQCHMRNTRQVHNTQCQVRNTQHHVHNTHTVTRAGARAHTHTQRPSEEPVTLLDKATHSPTQPTTRGCRGHEVHTGTGAHTHTHMHMHTRPHTYGSPSLGSTPGV